MRTTLSENVLHLLCCITFLGCTTLAFTVTTPSASTNRVASYSTSALGVSIGMGPEQAVEEEEGEGGSKKSSELVAGVDYEIPDHESYRTSRRSKLDEQCDGWFGAILGDETQRGCLGSLADGAREILLAPVPLINEVCIMHDA